MRGATYILTLLLATTLSVAAQDIPMLSRSALDGLVHPTLSSKGEGLLSSTEQVVMLGHIGDNRRHTATYRVYNLSAEDISITRLRPSCSCLTAEYASSCIAAGKSIDIDVEFNPAGRSGDFEVYLLVYTSLDSIHPSMRLSLQGSIEPTSRWPHLNITMGALHLSRRELTLDNLSAKGTRSERIACINGGDSPLRITAHSTIKGLSLHTEPEILRPEEEGDIVVSFSGDLAATEELTTLLIIEGVEASPVDRMIRVTLKK